MCPNGKHLVFRGKEKLNRNEGKKYQSTKTDCAGCPYAARCIQRTGRSKGYRTVYIPILKYDENLSPKMREAIDKPRYRKLYARRLQIIEPVFADIRYCKGMGTVYATPPVGGLASIRLGRRGNCVADASHASLRHILPALQMLRICLSGRSKRHIQPEHYAFGKA